MPRAERTAPEAAPTSGRRSEFSIERRKLGERIKLAREKMGLTQAQLAKKLGVSPGAVGQWEIERGVPATERLGALADFLGVSLDWLLGQPPRGGGTEAAGATKEDDLQLLEEARRLGVDLSQVVAEARQRRWLDENRQALTDANAFLARYGLWSDGKRQF
jgi:transcriptional regulator with XRE-family HTH domain